MSKSVFASRAHGAPRRIALLALAGASILIGCSTAGGVRTTRWWIRARSCPACSSTRRYATADNFVGTPIRGYEAARCLLRRPAAEALARVARDIARDGYALHVFDCYRPQRAVRHFVEWAHEPDDARSRQRYYPRVDKRDLLGTYIAETSGHSRGMTLDLTLVRCDAHACTPLDMGTTFDFFDERAHTDSPRVTAAQHANRERLRAAMTRHRFRNYPYEWWHYTLDTGASSPPPLDVPVR